MPKTKQVFQKGDLVRIVEPTNYVSGLGTTKKNTHIPEGTVGVITYVPIPPYTLMTARFFIHGDRQFWIRPDQVERVK